MLSDMSITAFLRRMKAESDTPGRVATAHGFRSSFRDWCSEQGYSRDLAERSLAHTIRDKVEAAYHRTDLLEQRRELMNAWENFVVGGEPAEQGIKKAPKRSLSSFLRPRSDVSSNSRP